MPSAKVAVDDLTTTATNIVNKAGVGAMRAELSKAQVKLRSNKKFRMVIIITTLLAVFVDILGTAMTMPVLPSICGYTVGGPVMTILNNPFITASAMNQTSAAPSMEVLQEMTDIMNSKGVAKLRAGGHLAAFDAASTADQMVRLAAVQNAVIPYAFGGPVGGEPPPFPFALSMNVVLSLGQIGSAGGSLFFGWLCDKIGCKLPMQICIFMGIVGYIFMLAGGLWSQNYFLYSVGIVWNNFFGNTMGVANVYFNQLLEGPEKDTYVQIVMSMAFLGAAFGAFIVMPFVSSPPNGENFFIAVWLALGLTVGMFFLASFVLVAPEKKEEEKKPEVKTPKFALRILVICIIASGLDSGGDEGTRMARGTILSALYPDWGTTNMQNYLLIMLIGVVFVTLGLLNVFRKCANLGVIAVFGSLCTLSVQIILAFSQDLNMSAVTFIIIWMCGKCFGFLSTFAANFMVMEIAPKELVGTWTGRNDAVTNLVSAATPILFSAVYDGVGNVAGTEMLMSTAAISLLAVLAYTPLIGMLPKPKPKEKPLELSDLETYDKLDDLEYSQLPLEIVDQITAKMIAGGKAPRLVSWGGYAKERASLTTMPQRAVKDFKYINTQMIGMLSDRTKMIEEQENFKKYKDLIPTVDRDKAKAEMGAWIADYFDDAGYVNWETQSQVYKTMLMTAFPPIDPLDDVKPDFGDMPVDQLEDNLAKLMAVMDEHLAASQRRVRVKISPDAVLTLLKRR